MGSYLWEYRENVVEEFYRPLRTRLSILQHVAHRSTSLQDVAAYLTLLGRKYDPVQKARPTREGGPALAGPA